MGMIDDEINDVKKKLGTSMTIEGFRIISATSEHLRIEISKSKVKTLTAMFQFPPDYPKAAVLIELRSKYLHLNLLSRLTAACEQSAKDISGKPQLISVIKFLNKFLEENPLCCCADEISSIKTKLTSDDGIKLKQKSSSISLSMNEKAYFYKVQVGIPSNYPESSITINDVTTNFPPAIQRDRKSVV